MKLLGLLASTAIVLLISGERLAGASGSISGTVKIPGLASNADAVVFVQRAPGRFIPPAEPIEMDQRGKQFLPHVLPIVVGTTVRFLNNDSTRHNVFSPDHERYNLGTWRQGQSRDHVFDSCPQPPCTYVQLCLLHAEMEAYVVVLQNPFFARTTADGRFEIRNVPAGAYTLAVWHAQGKAQPRPVAVNLVTPAVVDFVVRR